MVCFFIFTLFENVKEKCKMAKEGENFDIYDDSFIHYDNHLNDVDDIYSDMKIDKTISINLNSTPTNTFDKVFFFFTSQQKTQQNN